MSCTLYLFPSRGGEFHSDNFLIRFAYAKTLLLVCLPRENGRNCIISLTSRTLQSISWLLVWTFLKLKRQWKSVEKELINGWGISSKCNKIRKLSVDSADFYFWDSDQVLR